MSIIIFNKINPIFVITDSGEFTNTTHMYGKDANVIRVKLINIPLLGSTGLRLGRSKDIKKISSFTKQSGFITRFVYTKHLINLSKTWI